MSTNYSLPLTPIQRGMVFRQLVDPRSGIDVEQIVATVRESIDPSRLETAWQLVVTRHPILHSRIIETDSGEHLLECDPTFCPLLDQVEAAGTEQGAGFLEEWLVQDRSRGFDIFSRVPLRVALLRGNGAPDRCVWSFHHILLDGRSFGEILIEVWDAYDALMQGQAPVMVERPGTQAFLDWLRSQDQSQSLPYWQELLAGVEAPTRFPAVDEPVASPRMVLERQLGAELTDSIRQWALSGDVSFSSVVESAWATLLARHSDQDSVVFGSVRAGRAGHVPDAKRMLGVFINTVPVRARVGRRTGLELVRDLRRQLLDTRPHEHVPLAAIQGAANVAGELALFRTLLVFDHETLDTTVHRQRPGWGSRHFVLHEQTSYPVTLYAYAGDRLTLRLACASNVMSAEQASRVLDHLVAILCGLATTPAVPVRELPMLTDEECRELHGEWNRTPAVMAPTTIHAAVKKAAATHPDRPAVTGAGRTLDYAELDRAAESVAAHLIANGVARGDLVGLSLDRSPELVIGLLGILKAGAAYLPLDPHYPAERLDFCVRDAGVALVLTQRRHAHCFPQAGVRVIWIEAIESEAVGHAPATGTAEDLAYTIYTSGSTGNPKAVQVTHGNVASFFDAMDGVIDIGAEPRWLAVTSTSFDISVLELLWTLTRGFEVVVHEARSIGAGDTEGGPSFSLFHFASGMDAADPDPYRLIIEAAKFADHNGLEAVWSPERHFHDFGAPYPSPSVMNAALSTITSRVALRAGSVVLPLHDPVRVVEEWSLVDRLSHGRVGVSFASGWQPNDFVLAPANYERRKELMFEQIETVRALWRGEHLRMRNPKGDEFQLGTYPRPVQQELPVWVTAAGNPETFQQAGAVGANILTHMLGQTPADLENNIGIYRQARAARGLDPGTGRVTVMVHTFIGDDTDQVRELVRDPMKRYLRSAASLVGSYADAWSAYKRGAGSQVAATAMSELSPEELGELYDFAFERYFEGSGLFGSIEKCAPLVDALHKSGVDEIACLIDFGVAAETVIEHLPFIARLKDLVHRWSDRADEDIVEAIDKHRISHLQCTPSQARTIPMLVQSTKQLQSLRQLLIGGEALPLDLVEELYKLLPEEARIVNMYGPTETTIWSTCEPVARYADRITIGRPLANTRCCILDSHRQLMPPGCIGELHIGGEGVARGYLGREQLTAERFFGLPIDGRVRRVYATGDRARYAPDGRIEYLGRNDGQVKVRGHRVEPGEIEIALRAQPGIADAVVVARLDSVGSQQLVAYVVAERGATASGTADLLLALRRRVPEHMVPDTLAWLDALPLTPNGKIDRKSLAALRPAALVPDVQDSPSASAPANSEAMRIIGEIWQRVLNLPHVGPRENFFQLGGHSILAVKAQAELSQAFGRRLPIAELFRSPTIEALAVHFASDATPDSAGLMAYAAAKATKRRAAMGRRGMQERQRP